MCVPQSERAGRDVGRLVGFVISRWRVRLGAIGLSRH